MLDAWKDITERLDRIEKKIDKLHLLKEEAKAKVEWGADAVVSDPDEIVWSE